VYPPLKTILAGIKKSVTRIDARALGIDLKSIEPATAVVGISQPKPRLKKTAQIDSKLTAHERMKLLMAGGAQQKGSKTIEKAPQQAAAELIQFLIANGIIFKQ
jgi:electron transfer flavoprotein alpha/beta subunit